MVKVTPPPQIRLFARSASGFKWTVLTLCSKLTFFSLCQQKITSFLILESATRSCHVGSWSVLVSLRADRFEHRRSCRTRIYTVDHGVFHLRTQDPHRHAPLPAPRARGQRQGHGVKSHHQSPKGCLPDPSARRAPPQQRAAASGHRDLPNSERSRAALCALPRGVQLALISHRQCTACPQPPD